MSSVELEQLTQHQFDRFRNFIYELSGMRINDNKLSLLSNRIRRRLVSGTFDGFDDYYGFLTSPAGHGELGRFLDAVTTNETFFFRTQNHFDWLTTDFLSEVNAAHRRGQRPASLRIWSAGCATGAEPYTVAICLLENRHRLSRWSLDILGTDISEEALGESRTGVFRQRAVETVPERQRRRYFESLADDRWRVRTDVRNLVRFEHHNLMSPMHQDPFDCILIRNVLIYFDRESKRTVVDNLIRALAPGGYLIVGPSEGIYNMLEPLQRHNTFLYQKPHELSSHAV